MRPNAVVVIVDEPVGLMQLVIHYNKELKVITFSLFLCVCFSMCWWMLHHVRLWLQ